MRPQIERSRQVTGPPAAVETPASDAAGAEFAGGTTLDDSFGKQMLLKREDKVQRLSAAAGVNAFVTNNVALARANRQDDRFLVASAGVNFQQRFGYGVRLDLGAAGAAYRHDEFPELDFQSTDLSAGISWMPPWLFGAEVFLRYIFTDLTTAERVREFYKNHAILAGVQKAVALSRAQSVYAGASAQWSFADPQPAGRDEYGIYTGYHAQLSRRVGADLFYRYSYYAYRFGAGRRDQNHSASLSIRYAPADWISLSASTFAGWNRSNQPAFDYDVANAGVGTQVSIRF